MRVSLEGQSSEEKNLLSLSETCGKLSISIATGRNWIKLGKLLPAVKQKQTVFFSKDYVEELKQNLQSGKTSALKSRRNKKYVSGNGIYQSYISESSVNWSVVQDVLTSIKEQTKGEE